jgi:hypothetical protein
MNGIGDTKAGTLIATDQYGNKYFENLAEELPCKLAIVNLCSTHTDRSIVRTRWVDYKDKEFDPYDLSATTVLELKC